MASLTEALQAQCRAYMGSAGTFNEDLYGALAYLFQRSGAHLSELIAQAGGLQNLLYNGLWNPTALPLAAQALARKNGAALWYAGAAADLEGFVFEDSVGTLPATGTDPIGLLLDRSYGANDLGPELRNTGTLAVTGVSTGSSYDTGTGVCTLFRTDVSNRTDLLFSGLTIGSTYAVSLTNSGPSPVTVRTASGGSTLWSINPGQTVTGYAVVTSFPNIQIVVSNNASSAAFTLNSIKLVSGFPALQATAGNRPTLELQANGYYGIVGDGATDNFDIASILQGTGNLTIIVASNDPTELVTTRRFFSGAGGGTGLVEFYRNSTSGTASLRVRDDAGVDTFTAGPASAFGVPCVFSGVKAGNTKTVYANGVAGGINPTATGTSTVTATKLLSTSGGLSNAKGPVFLICAAQVDMPAADRTVIERLGALYSGASYP